MAVADVIGRPPVAPCRVDGALSSPGEKPHQAKDVLDRTTVASDGATSHLNDLDYDGRFGVGTIRDWVPRTHNCWPGHGILVALLWIKQMVWVKQTGAVDLTPDALQQPPWYHPALLLAREMEIAVCQQDARRCARRRLA